MTKNQLSHISINNLIKKIRFLSLLGGYWLLGLSLPSLAQPLSPPVMNDLPPAPPIPSLEEIPVETIPSNTPTSYDSLQAPPVSSPYEIREYNFEAQPVPNNNIPISPTPVKPSGVAVNGYRVEVYGSDSSLLAQIQQIEPNAYIKDGQGTIQAGFFENSWNAEKRVQELQTMGISSQIVIGTGYVNPPTPNLDNLGGKWNENGYLVVIPGNLDQLSNIAAQVRQLGLDSGYDIRLRSAPRGPHVAIGLFSTQDNAYQWTNFFRSKGLDARVVFGR